MNLPAHFEDLTRQNWTFTKQTNDIEAAQGGLITECVRRAGSEDQALLSAARGFHTTTLYGRFLLDPVTSRQIGHCVLLVQWRNDRKVVISR